MFNVTTLLTLWSTTQLLAYILQTWKLHTLCFCIFAYVFSMYLILSTSKFVHVSAWIGSIRGFFSPWWQSSDLKVLLTSKLVWLYERLLSLKADIKMTCRNRQVLVVKMLFKIFWPICEIFMFFIRVRFLAGTEWCVY